MSEAQLPPPKLSARAEQALARVRAGRSTRPAPRRASKDGHDLLAWAVGLLLLGAVGGGLAWIATDRPPALAQTDVAQPTVPLEPAPPVVQVWSDSAQPAQPPAAATALPSALPPPSTSGRSAAAALADFNRRLQLLQGLPPANCRPRRVAATVAAASIHRWRDPASGQWQYGNQPPPGVDAEPVQISDQARARFELRVESENGVEVPTQLRDRAAADVVRLSAILTGELGLPLDPDFTLELRFVGSAEGVVAGVRGMSLPRAAGLYLHADQRIVLWRQPDDNETFRTLRHEVVHALLHEFVGAPPLWLNEGLAEYFEALQTAGSGGRVEANAWYSELLSLAGDGRPALALETLVADASAFRNPRLAELYYAQSWALVDALMDSDGGQALLARLLADLREAACQPFSSIDWLERHYPGGAQALARAATGQRRMAHSF